MQCSGKPILYIVSLLSNLLCEACVNQYDCSGSYIWPSSSAPKYIPGFSVSIALMACCIASAFALMALTKKYPYELTKDGGVNDSAQFTKAEKIGEV